MINFGYLILHRVYAYVINLLIVTLGIIGLSQLNYAEEPREPSQTITVTARYDAPTQVLESTVERHISNAIAGVPGLTSFTSVTNSGTVRITCKFANANLDASLSAMRDSVAISNESTPREMRSPRVQSGDVVRNKKVLDMFIHCGDIPEHKGKGEYEKMRFLRNLALKMQSEIRSLPGVADCVTDDIPPNITLYLDPKEMRRYGVSISTVQGILNAKNIYSAGKISSSGIEQNISLDASMPKTDEEILDIYVPTIDRERYVQLRCFAKMHRTALSSSKRQEIDGNQGIWVVVNAKEDGNPISISQDVKKVVERFREANPVVIKELDDKGGILQEELDGLRDEIVRTILITLCIVGIVLGIRASVIAITTIPISIIGAFSIMRVCGITINTLTLLALILAIGLVVDDAIIVSENIEWYMSMHNMSPLKAALKCIREIQTAIVGMTLTLVAVFLPYFLTIATPSERQFIITLLSAVMLSGVVALTLSPTMCVQLLKPHSHSRPTLPKEGNFFAFAQYYISNLAFHANDLVFTKLHQRYQGTLSTILTPRVRGYVTFVLFPILTLLTGVVYNYLPRMEIDEEGTTVTISCRMPAGATIDYRHKYLKQIEKVVNKRKEKSYVLLASDVAETSRVIMGVPRPKLRPTNYKVKDIQRELINATRGVVPGVQIDTINQDRNTESDVLDIIVYGELSIEEIDLLKYKLPHILFATGMFMDVPILGTQYQPELRYMIIPDPHMMNKYSVSQDSLISVVRYAARAGLIWGHIEVDDQRVELGADLLPLECKPRNLSNYITQIPVSQLANPTFDELPRSSHDSLLASLSVEGIHPETKRHILVPLEEITRVETRSEPTTLCKYKGQRCMKLYGMVRPKVGLTKAYEMSKHALKSELRQGLMIDTETEMNSRGVLFATIAVFVVVFLFLAAVYESFIDPFIIMPTIVTALLGGCVGLLVYGGSITSTIILAAFLLMGLILKHGILLVSVSNDYLNAGHNLRNAALQAAATRFRPIMITTIAMSLGMFMLLLDNGTQAIMRQQLAIFVISGLTIGTFLTIFIVPCVYVVVKKATAKLFDYETDTAPHGVHEGH